MTIRLRTATVAAVAFSLLAAGPVLAAGTTKVRSAVSTDSRGTASVDTTSAIVELKGTPLAVDSSLSKGQAKRVDFKSTKTKSARAVLVAIRNDFKQWLRANAPKARVTSEYDVALNAVSVDLNGTSVDVLRTAPGVVAATLEQNYVMLADPVDPDLSLINAIAGWGAGAANGAGAGVKVAVIDSGIDFSHPCFSGAGAPAGGYPAYSGDRGESQFTNSKVIVAKTFNMRAKARGYVAFPADGQEHGTHVAGTIACEPLTPATVDGASIPYGVTGVAPAAQLGNYNVFPGPETNARSEDILNALQAAYEDGMDLANMSLGGGAHGVQDLLTHAVDNLDRGGMLVAISAGNEGPGLFTLGSPGSAERALTSGAYSVGHYTAIPVTLASRTVLTAAGEFPLPTSPLTAPLAAVGGSTLSDGCSGLPSGSLSGAIALVSRGTCVFSQKVMNAEAAGAVAVIVVNNRTGGPTAMAITPDFPSTIPAVMAGQADLTDLVNASGQNATIGSTPVYAYDPTTAGLMESFSSQGPSDVDFRVKPDVVAPGGNVLSSIPGNKWAFYSGTSMSSPHMAGMAAVILGQHPSWSAAQIRSALVNTANVAAVKNASHPLIIGNGAADLAKATSAKVALDPVSTSFGAVPASNGSTMTKTIAVSQLTGSAGALSVSPSASGGFTATVSGSTITVTFTPRAGVAGPQFVRLAVSDSSGVIATTVLFAWGK